MKLSKGFIVHQDGKDTLLVSTGEGSFSGLVRSNATAGFIIKCLEKDTTESEILGKMKEKFSGSEEQMKSDIVKVVSQLKKIGAIQK